MSSAREREVKEVVPDSDSIVSPRKGSHFLENWQDKGKKLVKPPEWNPQSGRDDSGVRVLSALPRARFYSQLPAICNSSSCDPLPSSGLERQNACTWYTEINTCSCPEAAPLKQCALVLSSPLSDSLTGSGRR